MTCWRPAGRRSRVSVRWDRRQADCGRCVATPCPCPRRCRVDYWSSDRNGSRCALSRLLRGRRMMVSLQSWPLGRGTHFLPHQVTTSGAFTWTLRSDGAQLQRASQASRLESRLAARGRLTGGDAATRPQLRGGEAAARRPRAACEKNRRSRWARPTRHDRSPCVLSATSLSDRCRCRLLEVRRP